MTTDRVSCPAAGAATKASDAAPSAACDRGAKPGARGPGALSKAEPAPSSRTENSSAIRPCFFIVILGFRSGYVSGAYLSPDAYSNRNPYILGLNLLFLDFNNSKERMYWSSSKMIRLHSLPS